MKQWNSQGNKFNVNCDIISYLSKSHLSFDLTFLSQHAIGFTIANLLALTLTLEFIQATMWFTQKYLALIYFKHIISRWSILRRHMINNVIGTNTSIFLIFNWHLGAFYSLIASFLFNEKCFHKMWHTKAKLKRQCVYVKHASFGNRPINFSTTRQTC